MTEIPEDKKKIVKELMLQFKVIAQATELINLFAQYTMAEDDSDMENITAETISNILYELVDEGVGGIVGETIMFLLSLIVYVGEPGEIQEHINKRGEQMKEELEAIIHGNED